MKDIVVGIDLGTTNSEIAGFHDGRVRVLGGGQMLPSCVGLSPGGELLVGQAARNQQVLYPDRTVRSIKRRMGSSDSILLGESRFTPQEVSALILRELAHWASRQLGGIVSKAIITVPAYFSDAQRQATREAGELAGLDVIRLINEPTAASLAYGFGDSARRTLMVYDLGGGTFDVSIVNVQDGVTEVLASHGNTQLGGDDLDQLRIDELAAEFQQRHGIDLREPQHRAAQARLWSAAEQAKRRLSSEPFATVREEALAHEGSRPLNLNVEISRERFERMIAPLVESTLESVSLALNEASMAPRDIDVVLLVGGSTRIPLVAEVLEERMGQRPRHEVHPDLCVALGAGLLASRLGGHEVDRVLVDVSPYSFGVSYLGERNGLSYPYCYQPIIDRNTPLPVTRTELFYTAAPRQRVVEIEVFQGEDPDAMNNLLVGRFQVEDLTPTPEPNEVLCRMKLDLDGILQVTAIEKRTSRSRQVTIADATRTRSAAELAAAQRRLAELFEGRHSGSPVWEQAAEDDGEHSLPVDAGGDGGDGGEGDEDAMEAPSLEGRADVQVEPKLGALQAEGRTLISRCRRLLDQLNEDDRLEAVDLSEEVQTALGSGDRAMMEKACTGLRDFLFFVEGR